MGRGEGELPTKMSKRKVYCGGFLRGKKRFNAVVKNVIGSLKHLNRRPEKFSISNIAEGRTVL